MFSRSVVLTVAVLSLIGAASAQSNGHQKSALELAVRTDKTVYRMSDEMRLETRITNVSSNDIYLWDWDLCWNPARGLSLHIQAADGSEVNGAFLLDCVPPPPSKGSISQFVKLGPHAFHGHFDAFKLKDLVNKPGEYDIEVTFKSFIFSEWISKYLADDPIGKLPLWTADQDALRAPRIHVTVKP